MRTNWFKSGDYNTICDVCGFKFKASDLRLRWDGLEVCREDWEIKHPQLMLRPIPDQQKLLWTRPEATDTFISTSCTVVGRQGVPGCGTPGCMIPGVDLGYRVSDQGAQNFKP